MIEKIISKTDSNQRIDNYVKKLLSDVPKGHIYKLFRKKDVKVNNKRVKIDYIIKSGDIINIYINKDEEKKLNVNNSSFFDFDVIYENKNILIINKKPGYSVQEKNRKDNSINNQIINYLNSKNSLDKSSVFKPSAIHRLDGNTSGVLVAAKNVESARSLTNIFKNRFIEKEYLCVLSGKSPKKGIININLKKMEKFVTENKDGKNAKTSFTTISNNKNYSLTKALLITGRTHQIRAHFKHLGNPILNDNKYGNKKENRIFKRKYNYKYQMLHAYKIKFLNINNNLSYLSNKTFVANLNSKWKEIIKKEFNLNL